MAGKTLLLVTKTGLGDAGEGHEQFGSGMLEKLLHTWESRPDKPWAICFYTRGVLNVLEGSPLLLGLRLLAGLGVRLVICGTCLEHYGVAGRVGVGEVGGMVEIVRLMDEADKVITV